MHTYSFEKLEVWQLGRELVKEVYTITQQFPANEQFCLTSQIRRSAISVPSNISEGSSRKSPKDRARFYQISFSSLMELLNQLIIARDLEYIQDNKLNQMRDKIEKISNKLNALWEKQMKPIPNPRITKSTNQQINKSNE